MKTFCHIIFSIALTFALSSIPIISCSSKLKLPGSKTDKRSVNIEELEKENKFIRILVANASAAFLSGTGKIFSAHGKKEKAKIYQAAADDIRKNPEDPQKLKDAMNMVEKGNRDLKGVEEEKLKLSKQGKKELGEGVILVGAGGILDVKGGKEASDYVDKLEGAIDVVKGDPVKYGAGTANMLKNNLNLMTFLATNLPKHGAAIKDTFSGLLKYASLNGVTISQSDAEKKAKDIEKG
jgi:hypothetical protein